MRALLSNMVDRLFRAHSRRRLSRYFSRPFAESLDRLALDLEAVPGMMSPEASVTLFALSASQQTPGDVVEIGSWQGRSTIYLARGAKVSGNGRVFAIDHFLGNPGKESLYRVGRNDLSDLPAGFQRNIEAFDVSDVVELLPMSSRDAAKVLGSRSLSVRLLFIDGNHDYESVCADYDAFAPFLSRGSLVVFDDFSSAFPGVVRCVEERISSGAVAPLFSYGNTFVGAIA